MCNAVATRHFLSLILQFRQRPYGYSRSQRENGCPDVAMTSRDFAIEIEPSATPERLNQLEQILRRMLADEDCRLAQLIDGEYLGFRMLFPSQAAQLCRDQAEQHLRYT